VTNNIIKGNFQKKAANKQSKKQVSLKLANNLLKGTITSIARMDNVSLMDVRSMLLRYAYLIETKVGNRINVTNKDNTESNDDNDGN